MTLLCPFLQDQQTPACHGYPQFMDNIPQSPFKGRDRFESFVITVSDISGMLNDRIPDIFKYRGQRGIGGAAHFVEGFELSSRAFKVTRRLGDFQQVDRHRFGQESI